MGNGKNEDKHQGVLKSGPRARTTSAIEHQQLYWTCWREVDQAQKREAQRIIVGQDGVFRNALESILDQ